MADTRRVPRKGKARVRQRDRERCVRWEPCDRRQPPDRRTRRRRGGRHCPVRQERREHAERGVLRCVRDARRKDKAPDVVLDGRARYRALKADAALTLLPSLRRPAPNRLRIPGTARTRCTSRTRRTPCTRCTPCTPRIRRLAFCHARQEDRSSENQKLIHEL